MKKIAIISFTEQGSVLADVIKNELTAYYQVTSDSKCRKFSDCIEISLAEWTKEKFDTEDALIYIGATGIAVRAIAPYVKSKTEDPAVLVIDEKGKYCIPLLSGHIGGANELAVFLCRHLPCDTIPIVTTATDLNGKWAVDVFARNNQLFIDDMEKAKRISARILAGETIRICMEDVGICKGTFPKEVTVSSDNPDIYIGIRKRSDCLQLVPRVTYLGIGCRKGTSEEQIESAVQDTLNRHEICLSSVVQAGSIDLKEKEPGIIGFCDKYGLAYQVYSAEELRQVPGNFEQSEFVNSVTSVDNVCERSAVCACLHAGGSCKVLIKKSVCHGVTVALAMRKWSVDFE